MKKLIYYSVAAWVVGLAAQAAGMSMPTVFLLSLTVPPALLIAWIVLKSRGIGRQTRYDYWTRPRR